MSSFRTTRGAAVLVVAALATTACTDSTGPTIDYIDAPGAIAASAPVAAVMDQPALASFTGIDGVGGLPAAASAAPLSAVSRLTAVAATGRWDRSTTLFARSAARTAAAPVLPADVHGKMYVYNTTTLQYEAAATAEEGTPAQGIRVILYAWDALEDQPSLPLTRVGHLDLVDESTTGEDKLSVVLRRASDNAALMDYDITRSVSGSGETFSIAGSMNGQITVNFNLTGTATQSSASITFHLSAPAVGYGVDVGATVNELTEQATVTTSLTYNNHTLSFSLSAHPNGIDGEVKFDGKLYATITVTIEETPTSTTVTTVVQKANGRPLTAEEFEQLGQIFERALNFDRFWAALLWPLGILAESPV